MADKRKHVPRNRPALSFKLESIDCNKPSTRGSRFRGLGFDIGFYGQINSVLFTCERYAMRRLTRQFDGIVKFWDDT